MANDLNMQFHGTQSTGTTFTGTDTTGTNGPTVDLGSSTVTRTLLLERRIAGSVTGNPALDIVLFYSTDNSTFIRMPGTTSAAAIGFPKAVTSSYGSTDSIAPSGPAAVARIAVRVGPNQRYLRAQFTTGTSGVVVGGVTVIGKVLSGAFSGVSGPIA